MKLLVLLLLFCALPTNVLCAQSSPPQPKHQVAKSQVTTKKQLSPEEQLWCPVLESALSGAAGAEPPMRSFLLDTVAGGLSKCAPQKVRNALVDSFTATLAIPETQEEVEQRERRFFRNRERPDEATLELRFNLQMKQALQRSALSHLLAIDAAKADSLLSQAEPDVRARLMHQMISQATSAKKFDRALALLSRIPSKESFPYGEATQLMLDLPPERDQDKQEIFRLAMDADREQHSLALGSDDFASMIVRFWRHVAPGIALDAIHQVLDAAQLEQGLTLNGTAGNVGFSSEYDYRVFELLPILRQLDNDEADKLLQSSQQAQLQLKQFPNGIQSLDPGIGDTAPKEGELVRNLEGSIGGLNRASDETNQATQAVNVRVQEIVRMAKDDPRQAIAAAATLPEEVGAGFFPSDLPRAQAYLGIARMLMEKSPSTASEALEQMAESLKHTAHPYQAIDKWVAGIATAREIHEVNLAHKLFRSGMEQADSLSDDADPGDPNTAPKCWWPSVFAYWQLVQAASQFSPQTALSRVREIKDPDILLLLEVRLANQSIGARADQSITMVRKKSSNWSAFRRLE